MKKSTNIKLKIPVYNFLKKMKDERYDCSFDKVLRDLIKFYVAHKDCKLKNSGVSADGSVSVK